MLSYLLDLVLYCLVSSINWVIKALGTLVGWIFNLLPTSPFVGYDSSWFHGIKYIEYVEWIIQYILYHETRNYHNQQMDLLVIKRTLHRLKLLKPLSPNLYLIPSNIKLSLVNKITFFTSYGFNFLIT